VVKTGPRKINLIQLKKINNFGWYPLLRLPVGFRKDVLAGILRVLKYESTGTKAIVNIRLTLQSTIRRYKPSVCRYD